MAMQLAPPNAPKTERATARELWKQPIRIIGALTKTAVRRFRDLLSPPLEIRSYYVCRRRKVCSTKLRSGTKRCAADRQSEFCSRRCHKRRLALRLDTDHLVSDE